MQNIHYNYQINLNDEAFMKIKIYKQLVALVVLTSSLSLLAMDKYNIPHLLGPFRSPESAVHDETMQKLVEKQKKIEQKICNRARIKQFIQECREELEKTIKKNRTMETSSSISEVEWLTPLSEERDIIKQIKSFLSKANRRTSTIALAYLFNNFNELLNHRGIIQEILQANFPYATIRYDYGCGMSFSDVAEEYKDKYYSVTLITFDN